MPRPGATPARSYGDRLLGTAGARGATFRLRTGPVPYYPLARQRRAAARISGMGVQYDWQGRRAIQQVNDLVVLGLERLRQRAIDYWRNEEWVQSRHPEMTGVERDSGFFEITTTGNRATFTFGATAPWAIFEEFGTRYRPGHYPIRNTLDKVAYRAADVIRRAARESGLA